jgi:hypothetical protein
MAGPHFDPSAACKTHSVPRMATLKSEHPLLAVRPREDKSGWYVEAWWTNRPSENIGHFATQSEARNWITLESASYFVLREIELMIRPGGASGALPRKGT